MAFLNQLKHKYLIHFLQLSLLGREQEWRLVIRLLLKNMVDAQVFSTPEVGTEFVICIPVQH